jgi:hypothetical protein
MPQQNQARRSRRKTLTEGFGSCSSCKVSVARKWRMHIAAALRSHPLEMGWSKSRWAAVDPVQCSVVFEELALCLCYSCSCHVAVKAANGAKCVGLASSKCSKYSSSTLSNPMLNFWNLYKHSIPFYNVNHLQEWVVRALEWASFTKIPCLLHLTMQTKNCFTKPYIKMLCVHLSGIYYWITVVQPAFPIAFLYFIVLPCFYIKCCVRNYSGELPV